MEQFISRVRWMGMEQVVSAARSPWQNPYVERVIGILRRESTDHVILTGAAHLRRVLREYVPTTTRRPHARRGRQGLADRSPLTLSLLPRCQGLWGSQKYTWPPVSIVKRTSSRRTSGPTIALCSASQKLLDDGQGRPPLDMAQRPAVPEAVRVHTLLDP